MKTDIQSIHDECREIASLLQSLESAAVKARGATDAGPKSAGVEEVERAVRAVNAALARVSGLAARRGVPRTGIPDPVTDLDQDPQD